MGVESAIIAGGFTAFLFLYASFKFGQLHFAYKMMLIALSAMSLLVMGNAVLQDGHACSWNVVNSTTTGLTVNYEYDYQCTEEPISKANLSFYRLTLWHLILMALYMVIFLFWLFGKGMATAAKKGLFRKK